MTPLAPAIALAAFAIDPPAASIRFTDVTAQSGLAMTPTSGAPGGEALRADAHNCGGYWKWQAFAAGQRRCS